MNDKAIMENLLLTTKGVCDLYMHGAIESNTQPVHSAFNSALTSSLSMQEATYKTMAAKGWYPTETAPPPQIDAVRQKFTGEA